MANIKSAIKRAEQSEKKRVKNVHRKTALKTTIKKFLLAVESSSTEQAQALLKQAYAQLARAKGKGLIHANTAARKMSRLAKRLVPAKTV